MHRSGCRAGWLVGWLVVVCARPAPRRPGKPGWDHDACENLQASRRPGASGKDHACGLLARMRGKVEAGEKADGYPAIEPQLYGR